MVSRQPFLVCYSFCGGGGGLCGIFSKILNVHGYIQGLYHREVSPFTLMNIVYLADLDDRVFLFSYQCKIFADLRTNLFLFKKRSYILDDR